MHALAEQLKETFTKSGMTPEDLFNTFEKDGDGEAPRERRENKTGDGRELHVA